MLDQLGVRPVVLGITKDGHPKHPLYLPYGAELVPFLTGSAKTSKTLEKRGKRL